MAEEARAIHDMASQVTDIRVMVASMNSKLDAVVSGHSDHETRMRTLENAVPSDLRTQLEDLKKFKWLLLGAATVMGGAAGKLVGLM